MDKAAVVERLASLGYKVDQTDSFGLGFVIEKVKSQINNTINQQKLPEGLTHVAIDMVCGEFLKGKKASGDFAGFAADIDETLLAKDQQGDTSFAYSTDKTQSAEERLDALIEHLIYGGKQEMLRFRRFEW